MEKKAISWSEFGRSAEHLVSKIRAAEISYDLVIGIARGGIPAALLIANRLRIRIDFVNIKSYIRAYSHDKPKILSTLSEEVKNRWILVVDDIVDSGDTMRTILEWLRPQDPKKIETAALFVKPWSSITPNYFVRKVSEWIVFPWENEQQG